MSMVLNEDQQQQPPMCSSSNTSGGGTRSSSSSSKKNKQRKTPQRGMGVAQLEELRLREQQHKNGEEASSSSGLALPLPPPPPPQQPSIPNPFLPRSSSSLPIPSNGINYFGNNNQTLPHNTLEGSEDCNSRFFTMHSDVVTRNYNTLAFQPSDSPPRRPPVVPQRSHHQRQFSMANKILSPSSSSGVSLQIEPPSNQSYSSNYHNIPPEPPSNQRHSSNYHNIPPEPPSNQSYSSNYHYIPPPAWPDEEKVAGVKRPWPFHPDSLTGYGGTIPCRVPVFRESTSTNHVDCRSHNNNHHGKSTDDDGFLTLGPYAVPSISRSKHPFPPSHLPDYPTSSQVSTEDGLSQSRVSSEQPPFYSFLPVRPDSHETASNERHGEASDSVDLNLKL